MEKKKPIILTVIASVTLILLVVGATFAYFQAQGGIGTSADIRVTTYTTDLLTFTTGSDIAIYADQSNFAEGLGNKSGETFAKAHLIANNKTNSTTDNYHVFLSINNNTFEYTQEDKTPELILQVTDPNGAEVTSIDGLDYKTVTDGKGSTVKGFDITTKLGMLTLVNNHEIVANPEMQETWNVNVVFVNLNEDQSANAGRGLTATLKIQKEPTLVNWVIAQYNGIQGNNSIYYHDENLENGAGDNSYRYSGGKAHPAYFTCTYNNASVLNYESSDYNYSLQGECDTIYKASSQNIYIDASFETYFYNEPVNISWNIENNTCLTSDGYEVFDFNGESIIVSDFCTGVAYPFQDTTYYFIGIKKVGSGVETLYDTDNNLYTCKYNGTPVATVGFVYNSSSQGDCSTVYKISYQHIYMDKSYENYIGETVSVEWDTENQMCKTVNGDIVYVWDGKEISEPNFCSGTADYNTKYNRYFMGITKVGSGTETIYKESSNGVNNYVCFGSEEKTCSDDNLYRIIGVFDGRVRLIKSDYATSTLLGTDTIDYYGTYYLRTTYYQGNMDTSTIGVYYWNNANNSASFRTTGYFNDWSYSELNKTHLNKNFLNNIGSKWADMIDMTTWNVEGISSVNVIPSTLYADEITSPLSQVKPTYESKVGLMYVSDYGFAASPSAWTTTLYNYDGKDANGYKITDENWMYMGLSEWTMTRAYVLNNFADASYAHRMNDTGYIFREGNYVAKNSGAVRPVFHLPSKVEVIAGDGTRELPLRLS